MTEFPTLCALHYDRDDIEKPRSTTVGLRLPKPRRPRSRSRTYPRGEVRGKLESLANGVNGAGDHGGKIQLTTPYRYSSSKSSSLQASKDDLLYPDRTYSSSAALGPHDPHHRSLSEPPPNVSERARTAPTAFSLPMLRQGGAGETSMTVNAELLQDPEWNEYLSAWVSGKQASSNSYVSFVGAMSLKDRGRYHYVREFEELPSLPCPRFFEHMHHIPAPKALWKDKKTKSLQKPEFWTWKGRTSPKIPKSRPIRKKVYLCNSLTSVQVTPPSSVQCLTVDIPTCSVDSEESLSSTPTFDLCSLSNQSPSLRGVSPDRSPVDQVLPEIEESSEHSDYGSIRSGASSPLSFQSHHTVTSVPLKLHKLENPPCPPSIPDWDMHSFLADFEDVGGDVEDDVDRGHGDTDDDEDGRLRRKYKEIAMGPLESSKVDQSGYMYNDHVVFLEPVVFESCEPIEDMSKLMEAIRVPGCLRTLVDPYPLEEPLRPDVADVDRVAVQQSSICERPSLPTPPPPKVPTPTPTPPPPMEPTPPPPKTPTPPPIEMPKKKPGKPKRPPKKEKMKVQKKVRTPVKEPTPVPEPPPVVLPPTPPPPTPPEPEVIKAPTPEPIRPKRVIELPPLPVVSEPEPEESESEISEAPPADSPEPDQATPEPAESTPPSSPIPASPSSPPLRRSPIEKDMSYALELERQRLADERQRKALLMYEKLRSRQPIPVAKLEQADSFKEYGWLAQFCILKPDKLKMYRLAFDTVDEDGDGLLSCFDTLIALKGITGTQNLTEKEEEYICRILEIANYNILEGSDFRVFSVMAALSQKLTSIDKWVRNLIKKFDLQMLDWKMYRAKELFKWCVDESTNRISVPRLLIELRAGGVSDEHLEEVKEKFGEHGTLDLLDFLAYLPLFIMSHEAVVFNPLNNIRDK
ncbi:uncharacterized protein LOC117291577 isoform X2 [Asterias rubens]|uniref:uncharacterized protein LOC117291577 isoform X2 n=1 Tax=Asterias rubens TaxID=7604 RepID=UPI00145587A2|nr:uncharacterized protein LOC117291577 isoform X2 [Asterias rubens]